MSGQQRAARSQGEIDGADTLAPDLEDGVTHQPPADVDLQHSLPAPRPGGKKSGGAAPLAPALGGGVTHEPLADVDLQHSLRARRQGVKSVEVFLMGAAS